MTCLLAAHDLAILHPVLVVVNPPNLFVLSGYWTQMQY